VKEKSAGKKAISFANGAVNLAALTLILLLLAFAGYALWDSGQLYHAADKAQYAVYKPTAENEGKTFGQLQALNAEVIAWLSVYGTNIDYPVTQAADNTKYVNTNAEGVYSLSGAIFLDCANRSDFSDFNSILYGHHMERKAMFGEIGTFADKKVFDTHRYGNLYCGGKDYGIAFFAFVHCDAYDNTVFAANVQEAARKDYLDDLLEKAAFQRDIGVTADDRIVLLSTCSTGSTNGRDILIGRITDTTYADPFANGQTSDPNAGTGADGRTGFFAVLPRWLPALLLVLAALLPAAALVKRHKRKQRERRRQDRWHGNMQ